MNDLHSPSGAVLTRQPRGKAAWIVNQPAVYRSGPRRDPTPKPNFLLLLLRALGALSV